MNIEEIADTLPNGFHDALVRGISLDYERREVVFALDVWVGDLDSDDPAAREEYRCGVLKLSGLLYFVVEPPDVPAEQLRLGEEGSLWLTADSSDFGELKSYPKLPEPLPGGGFRHWFFVSDLNCFMYIAATAASFVWE